MRLHELVLNSAEKQPGNAAVSGPDGILTYETLDRLANKIARALRDVGVRKGDRVAIWLDKSTTTVAVMQGVLRVGAAYVPIDPLSPVTRAHTIMADCDVAAVVTTHSRADAALHDELADVPLLCVDTDLSNSRFDGLAWNEILLLDGAAVEDPATCEDDLAYILYTSGSTGTPKGVCISHRNAMAFIEWAAEELRLSDSDRLANHAPFHFDLSVLDLYVAFHSGGCVCLIPDGIANSPKHLANWLASERPTVWYSVPSALVMMLDHAELLDWETPSLHTILFAGEVFPIVPLRRLAEKWSSARLLNLYGPTETNVCTFHEVQASDLDRDQPVPIGTVCSGNSAVVRTEDGEVARSGQRGELMIIGPTVALGYWGKERQYGAEYPTGDIVEVLPDGRFDFVGRRDNMVKIRGHRVELGEIEAALLTHPGVGQSAVVAAAPEKGGKLVAFIVPKGESSPNLLQVKTHCSQLLPRYMIVDKVRYVDSLPRTRNGKTDRRQLVSQLAGESS